MSKKLAAIAALSMLSVSSAGLAQAAAPAPAVRAGGETAGSNELVGATSWLLAALLLGLVVWGAIKALDDNTPSSP